VVAKINESLAFKGKDRHAGGTRVIYEGAPRTRSKANLGFEGDFNNLYERSLLEGRGETKEERRSQRIRGRSSSYLVRLRRERASEKPGRIWGGEEKRSNIEARRSAHLGVGSIGRGQKGGNGRE